MIKAYVKNNMLYVEAKEKIIPDSSIITRSEFILRIPLEEVEYVEYAFKQYVDPSSFEWDFLKVKGNMPIPYATITICCKFPYSSQEIPIIYYDLSIADQDANMLVTLLKQHNIID